jgi:hypothetical protein
VTLRAEPRRFARFLEAPAAKGLTFYCQDHQDPKISPESSKAPASTRSYAASNETTEALDWITTNSGTVIPAFHAVDVLSETRSTREIFPQDEPRNDPYRISGARFLA